LAETRRKRAVAAGRSAESAEDTVTPSSTYALRLNQALEAISAAQAATPAREAAAVEAPRKTVRRTATVAAPSAARLQAAKAAGLLPPTTPTVDVEAPRPTRTRATRRTATVEAVESTAVAAPAPRTPTRRTSAKRIDLASEAPLAPAPVDLLLEAAAAGDDSEVSLDEALESDRRFAALLDDAAEANRATRAPAQPSRQVGWRAWLAALEKLPPIRLPIGPAIPWKLGLPALVGLVILMASMSHGAQADSQGVQLPAQETYAVQQTSPLFADAQKDAAQTPAQADTQTQTQAPAQAGQAPTKAATIGVQDPAGGFDFVDVAIKLAAVLGLAYGSLLLLKRVGVGGAGARSSGGAADLKLVSSLALAPNRTVHVISAPGGKSLLVGATPNQVNLIAELGLSASIEADEAPAAEASSFFDVLAAKLPRTIR